MRHISFNVNGERREVEVEPRELLVYVLRERLGLTGTNVGCDTSSCGSCTVLTARDRRVIACGPLSWPRSLYERLFEPRPKTPRAIRTPRGVVC